MSDKETKATHTPWVRATQGKTYIFTHGGAQRIAECGGPNARANAAIIVRAVNNHADLLAALKYAIEQIEMNFSEAELATDDTFLQDLRDRARAAIQKAEAV